MLKIRHLLLAGVALLSLTPYVAGGPAFANDDRGADRSSLYARYGWWEILRFDDGTCFAYANYEYNQRIRIGVVAEGNYYIMLNSPGVESLAAVNGFPIVAKFDNGEGYKGKANVSLEGTTKIMEFPIGTSMMDSFMQASNMYIHANTKNGWKLLASMNLKGSYAAMLKTAECTAANGGSYSRPGNPFQSVSAGEQL